jgi:hypothetical protein
MGTRLGPKMEKLIRPAVEIRIQNVETRPKQLGAPLVKGKQILKYKEGIPATKGIKIS